MKNRKIGLLSISLSMAVCLFGGTFSNDNKNTENLSDGAVFVRNLTQEEIDHPIYAQPFEVYDSFGKDNTKFENGNQDCSMSILGNGTNMEDVWNAYRGDGTTIAIIDTGIDYSHPDFKFADGTSKILDTSRYYFVNGTQITYNQYGVLGTSSYNFLDHVSSKNSNGVYELQYHGSNVASTAASAINGNGGCVGIAPNAKILVLKTDMNLSSINEAIKYATDQNVDVINMSLGAYEDNNGVSTYLSTAINSAYNKGIIVVAAAGNENTSTHSYPACNTHVIGVGALASKAYSKASFSNFNASNETSSTTNVNVDLSAPGYVYAASETATVNNTTVTNRQHSFTNTQGTSFASPIVAGAACLWKQAHPTGTPDQFESALYAACDDIGTSGWDTTYGHGALNIKKLLFSDSATPTSVSIKAKDDIVSGKSGDHVQLYTQTQPLNSTNKAVTWSSTDSSIASVSDYSGVLTFGSKNGTVTLTATSASNSSAKGTITVTNTTSVSVTSVSFTNKTITLGKDESGDVSTTFPYTVLPSGANQAVTFESSDETALTVDDGEWVSGIEDATVTLTVKSQEDPTKYDTCTVIIGNGSGTGGDSGETGGTKSYDYSGASGTYDDWSYTTDKNGGTDPTSTRLYAKNKIIFTSSTKEFEKVVINTTINKNSSGKYPDSATTTKGTLTGTFSVGTNKTITIENFESGTKSFTVTLGGSAGNIEPKSFDITFKGSSPTPTKSLSSIAVISNNHRTFSQGDAFVKETITATYSDDTTLDVTISAIFSGYNMSNTGTQTVSVSYTEGDVTKNTSYTITVNAVTTGDDEDSNEVTITFGSGSSCDVKNSDETTINGVKVQILANNGWNSSNVKILQSTSFLTVTANNIVSIEFSYTGASGDGISANGGTYSNKIWTVDDGGTVNSVTFKTGTGSQTLLSSIKVTLKSSGGSDTPVTPTYYTVSFNSNGGSGTMANATTNGSSYTVPACEFTYTGHTFDKWALNSASGTKYAVGDTITGISANITLYATWTENSTPTPDYGNYYKDVNTSSLSNIQSTLHSTISANTVDVGYDGLFNAYKTTDVKPGTNYFWDMYSNENYTTTDSRINKTYSDEGDSINREHTIPQSWFNESSPMKADLFHVYPTDGYVNNRRSNYPHADVSSATYTSKNGSKLGTTNNSALKSIYGNDAKFFEVIDEYKGDFARSYFYFATRYSDKISSFTADGKKMFKTSAPYMASAFIDVYYQWHLDDPVSEKEINRNNAVYSIQKNRNPYIDHPEWVAIAFGKSSATTKTLSSITLSGSYQTTFSVGDTFSYTGLVVTANYSDGTHATVTPTSVSSPSMSSAGTKTVTVTYTEGETTKTATYDITVSAKTTDVTSITLSQDTAEISVGETLTLVATVLPDNATDKSVTWSTSDNSVATVANGVVTGVKAGTATITAKTSNNKSATCSVTVKAKVGDGETVYAMDTSEITIGASCSTSYASYGPENGTGKGWAVTLGSVQPAGLWMGSNSNSTNKGKMKLSNGSIDGATGIASAIGVLSSDTYYSALIQTASSIDNVGSVKLTYSGVGGTAPSEAWILYSIDNGITWSVLSKATSLSTDGTIFSNSNIKNIESARYAFVIHSTNYCQFKVPKLEFIKGDTSSSGTSSVTGVSLDKTSLTLDAGISETLTATITPSNATNKNVTWASSDASVATVSDGTITALKAGTTTITVTTEDGGYTATCQVTVLGITKYELVPSKDSISYMEGKGTTTLSCDIYVTKTDNSRTKCDSVDLSVDTSSLGSKTISTTYKENTISATIKITNSGTNYQESVPGPDEVVSTSLNNSNKFSTTNKTVNDWTVDLGGTTYTGNSSTYNAFGSSGSSFNSLMFTHNVDSSKTFKEVSIKVGKSNANLSDNLVAYYTDENGVITNLTLKDVKNGSGSLVTSTGIPVGSNGSNMYTFTFVMPTSSSAEAKRVTCAGTQTPTVTIGVDGSSGGKQLYVGNLSLVYGTTTTPDNDFTLTDQARAWAQYMIEMTRTESACLANTDEQKLAGLKDVWSDLASEYSTMADGAKDAFFESDDLTIVEAREHYKYIIKKFGENNLTNFVKDSNNNTLPANKQSSLLTNFGENNSSIILAASVALLGVTAIGLYFASKKRKED